MARQLQTYRVQDRRWMAEGKLGDFDADGDMDIVKKPYNWSTPRIDSAGP